MASGAAARPSSVSRRTLVVLVVVVVVAGISVGAYLLSSGNSTTVVMRSESMEPTIEVGDRVTFDEDVECCERGGIVLFKSPPRATPGVLQVIKRVIGMPGETVTTDADGTVLINGRVLREPYLAPQTTTRFLGDVPPGCDPPNEGGPGLLGCVVPAGHVFVLGDNRAASKDSRAFGPIPINSVTGISNR